MAIKRFDKLIFPVFSTEGNLLEAIPQLKHIDGFKDCHKEKRNEKIRYILAMYDKKSPLIDELADLEQRKAAACHESGLLAPLDLAKATNLRMVLGFLFYQHSEAFTMIAYLEENFQRNTKELMAPVDRPTKKKNNDPEPIPVDMSKVIALRRSLRQENSSIKDDLDQLRREVFGDNSEVYEELQVVRRTSPEAVAKMKIA